MDAKQLIHQLEEKGYKLFTNGENLKIIGGLTSKEERLVMKHENEIISELIYKGKSFWQSSFSEFSLRCDFPVILNGYESRVTFSTNSNKYHNKKFNEIIDSVHKKDKSFSTYLLTAWVVLLHRYTSQEKIPLVTNIFSKSLSKENIDEAIFVDVSENTSFTRINDNLLHTAKQLEQYYFPGIKWIEEHGNSLLSQFNVSFSYFNGVEDDAPLNIKNEPFDLSLIVHKKPNDVNIEISANSRYFNENELESMARHLHNILINMLEDETMSISTCSMLSTNEIELLNDFHGQKRRYPFEKDLITLFEDKVEQFPNNIAVITEAEKIDYMTLNKMSNYIGHQLIKAGVEKGTPVGVYLDRSVHTYIALLGILKVGGIYVPLDASYPTEYISQIKKELQLEHIISKNYLEENLPGGNVKITFADEIHMEQLSNYEENLGIQLNSQDTAIIMYTSGSTGIPKGVKHKQIQLINRLNWVWENYPFTNNDVMCQRTALNFMPSMWELLGGLLQGVPTVIISDKVIADPVQLLKSINKYQITFMMAVPSLLKMMFQANLDGRKYASSVRLCITAGEPLTAETFNQFQELFSNAILLNDFGSTETNGVLYFDSNDKQHSTKLPNFKPIANTKIYILDKYLNQVPVGVIGYIYIGGAPLALEYVNNRELNEKSFIHIPHISKHEKLYRLGDRARFLADGTIQLFGREDHQVKIRGKRVELGHIESALYQHNSIKESVVVAKKTKSNNHQLYAYIVLKKYQKVTEESVKTYLNQILPDYMVPFRILVIDSIPRKPNGKKDLKALIDDAGSTKQLHLEQENILSKLKKMVSDILEVDDTSISTTKKFYAIGFDSVSIVEFAEQINKQLTIEIEVTDLYNCNHLQALAQFIMKRGKGISILDTSVSNDPACTIGNIKVTGKKEDSEPDRLLTTGKASFQKNSFDNPIDIYNTISECVTTVLEIESTSVQNNKKLYEVGFDSVSIVSFVTELNKRFEIDITTTDLYNSPTLQDVVLLVNERLPSADSPREDSVLIENKSIIHGKDNSSYDEILSVIKKNVADILEIESKELGQDQTFEDLSFSSADFIKYIRNLNHHFGSNLSLLNLIENPSFHSLTNYLMETITIQEGHNENNITASEADKTKSISKNLSQNVDSKQNAIAIIGFSGKFPDAMDVNEFWRNIAQGSSAIQEVPEQRWKVEAYYDPNPQSPNKTYSKWGGFIPDVDKFDSEFFNISKYEAKLMDPQQRLLLEEAYRALEHAAYSDRSLDGRSVGTFIGIRKGDYATRLTKGGVINNSYSLMGNDSAILSARLAYLLNLKGPSLSIDTACSSSLVAIHQACQAIKNDEIEMAIAGGAHVMSTADLHVISSKMGMLSPDGLCKTFDNEANGFVPGEAVGFVVLKDFQKALEDGDYIHAVIKGSGLNQDGTTNGITAPSVDSQEKLIEKTLRTSEVDPDSISMIEAHGTGTKLGDPIEVKALTNAFQKFTKKKQFSAIGSVKTNIGHAVAGAGIASLIKVIMSLKHKQIPKSLNYLMNNEHINFKDSPFYVNTTTKEWEPTGKPRRSSISSFGFSGTNCYMIVEEAPVRSHLNYDTDPYYLMTLSAKNKISLKQKLRQLYQWTKREGHQFHMGDIAYSLLNGRSFHAHRLAFLVSNQQELADILLQTLGGSYQNVKYGVLESGNDISSLINEEQMTKVFNYVKDRKYLSSDDYKGNLSILAEQFVQESDLEWDQLFLGRGWRSIPLPVYPFSGETFWIEDTAKVSSSINKMDSRNDKLVYSNKITIDKHDLRVDEHQIANKRIIPAAMYIELVWNEIEKKYKQTDFTIKNFFLMKPIVVNEQVDITLEITDIDQQHKEFRILVENERHVSGNVFVGNVDHDQKRPNINRLISPSIVKVNKDECYSKFDERGITYGRRFQLLNSLFINDEYVVGSIESSSFRNEITFFMDAVFQTAIGFSVNKSDLYPYMPLTIDEIKVNKNFKSGKWVLVNKDSRNEKTGIRNYSFSLFNDENIKLMEINGFIQKAFKFDYQSNSILLYTPRLKVTDQSINTSVVQGITLIIDVDHALSQYNWEDLKCNKLIIVTPGLQFKNINNKHFILDIASKQNFARLLKEVSIEKINNVVYFTESDMQSDNQLSTVLDLFSCLQTLLEGCYQKEMKFMYTFINKEKLPQPQHEAVVGLFNVLKNEYSGFKGKVVEIQKDDISGSKQKPVEIINQELTTMDFPDYIVYRNKKRLIRQFEQVNFPENIHATDNLLKKNGVYIIAGGIGGLGQIFAKYLASSVQAKIVLTGRKPFNNDIDASIKQINLNGGEALYFQCDISERYQVEKLLQFVMDTFNDIHGVFHSAGIVDDSLFRNKSIQQVSQVFRPKMNGTLYLDELTKDLDLQLFVLFSSISPLMGNIGQSDYAYANNYIDVFAHRREELRKQGHRTGKTIAINWPYWKDGGMKMDINKRITLQKELGLYDLEKEEGINAFEMAMTLNHSQLSVIKGEAKMVKQMFEDDHIIDSKTTMQSNQNELVVHVQEDLIELVQQLFTSDEEIDVNRELAEYGLNSITITEFSSQVSNYYEIQIPPSVFFEHSTLYAISEYLCEQHQEVISNRYEHNQIFENPVAEVASTIEPKIDVVSKDNEEVVNQSNDVSNDIAIVGLSAKFPGADSVEEFWDNLINGHSSISVFPAERKNWGSFYEDSNEKEKVEVNRGGFVTDIEKFDPSFFGISPSEAKLIDPQQRILLQQVWIALEDSGHKPSSLSGEEVGVFIGAFTNDYSNLLIQEGINEGHTAAGNDHSILANRISYLFNFKGPSEAIDTACSSSLVALHRSIQSLQLGECKYAVVGGVNALLSSHGFIRASKAGMLSKDEQIRSFDHRADGYLRGEGFGVVILKPLKDALAHDDNVYAVIKGTAINHSGKGFGLTTPSVNGQSEVMTKALRNANVSPESLSYIEAHGTASKLGDSIEIDAFKKVFRQFTSNTSKENYCGISTVKPNIGHTEAASGIASLIKAVLALKYKQIPPTINVENVNEDINLEESPFYLVDKPTKLMPVAQREGSKPPLTRVGVHSFGFGGTNAHIILEEFIGQDSLNAIDEGKYILPFSAKTKTSLIGFIQSFKDWLKKDRTVSLRDIAYTLQTGKEEFSKRVVMIVSNHDDLINQCEKYIEGKEHPCFEVESDDGTSHLSWILDEEVIETITYKAIINQDFDKLAKLWTTGYSIKWERLYKQGTVSKISLPSYEFEKHSIWYKEIEPKMEQNVGFSNQRKVEQEPHDFFQNQLDYKNLLANLLTEVLGMENLDPNVNLNNYGYDSIMAIKLKYLLEENLSMEIPLEILIKSATIESIELYLTEHLDPSRIRLNNEFDLIDDDLSNVDEETLINLFEKMND